MFLEVKVANTSVERSLGSTSGTKFQHIIFVIIESGTTLLVIQLVRMVLWIVIQTQLEPSVSVAVAFQYNNTIAEMFNVIIRSIYFYFFYFTENFYLARASHQQ